MDYELGAGTAMRLADTPYGAGDGTYAIGPGKARLLFTSRQGEPADGDAALLALEVTTKFTVNTTAMGFKMRIGTDGVVTFAPDGCGVVARGTLSGTTLTWSEKARGYRSRATMHCSGALCGKFGSPPSGRSHISRGPKDIRLKPLKLSEGLRHLSMGFVEVERQRQPSQTVLLRLEGRETERRCVPAPRCEEGASQPQQTSEP